MNPTQVLCLADKKIIDFSFGDKFMVALTISKKDGFESTFQQSFRESVYQQANKHGPKSPLRDFKKKDKSPTKLEYSKLFGNIDMFTKPKKRILQDLADDSI